jgi:hypothetical protein
MNNFFLSAIFALKVLSVQMENALNSEKSLKNLPISTNFGPKPKLQSLNEQKTISL